MNCGRNNGFRKAALERLTRVLGLPVQSGDCCQWVLRRSPDGSVRLSIFVDGPPDHADGWLYLTQDRHVELVAAASDGEIDELVARCLAATGGPPPPEI